MDKASWVYLCGLHSLFFAVFHACFWKLFRWDKDLQNLTSLNRAIMQVLNLRITYLSLFLAFVCFRYPQLLYSTELGHVLLVGFSIFWLGRTIEQFIFFKFDRPVFYIFTALFLLGAVIFLLPTL